jgi:hypothetical protein
MALKLLKNKKAVFFLLTVILFLGVLTIVLYAYNSYTLRDKQQIIEIRIRSMNDFINDFHNDLHRSTRISATRALISLEDYIATNQVFFNNKSVFEEAFREAFYYGTISGIPVQLMDDASFQDYESKLNSSANSINIIFSINVTSISLSQANPWNINVTINATIGVDDFSNLSHWIYNASFITSVPIDGLRDPLYSLNTYGRIQNTIHPTNITDFINNTNNDTANLLSHLENSLYVESTDAPSFLKRFYNDTSPDTAGITSMVNVELISDQGLSIYSNRPILDYEYFNPGYSANVCNVYGMPSWFKINSTDLNYYEINTINYTGCS